MKGLEAFERIVAEVEKDTRVSTFMFHDIVSWLEDKKLVEKELKALEIIKNKLSPLAKMTFLHMTQEEYELVEEVLKDD